MARSHLRLSPVARPGRSDANDRKWLLWSKGNCFGSVARFFSSATAATNHRTNQMRRNSASACGRTCRCEHRSSRVAFFGRQSQVVARLAPFAVMNEPLVADMVIWQPYTSVCFFVLTASSKGLKRSSTLCSLSAERKGAFACYSNFVSQVPRFR